MTGYWAVLPAAGAGLRFGGELPKQYAALAGRTVIEWALAPFLDDPRCQGVVVALSAQDQLFAALGLQARHGSRLRVVPGGAERCESVLAGLLALPAAPDDLVMVHDAARPCLTRDERDRLLAVAAQAPAGALLALPVADTLKRGDADGRVQATVPRQQLWRAQTPQVFGHALLLRALRESLARGERPTDESQAVEALGLQPCLVEGQATNLKITRAADLPLAQALLVLAGECA